MNSYLVFFLFPPYFTAVWGKTRKYCQSFHSDHLEFLFRKTVPHVNESMEASQFTQIRDPSLFESFTSILDKCRYPDSKQYLLQE